MFTSKRYNQGHNANLESGLSQLGRLSCFQNRFIFREMNAE